MVALWKIKKYFSGPLKIVEAKFNYRDTHKMWCVCIILFGHIKTASHSKAKEKSLVETRSNIHKYSCNACQYARVETILVHTWKANKLTFHFNLSKTHKC